MRFQYHPEAARELTRSIEYYEEKAEELGAEFLKVIYQNWSEKKFPPLTE